MGIAYGVYYFIYSKYDKECQERKSIYERFYNISVQLDDFSKTQTKIDELKDSLEDAFAIYKDTFYSNEQNMNAYKVRILDLLKEIEISTEGEDTVVQTNTDDNIELQLKLKASYNKICKFLFELERYSKVNSIVMDYKDNVEIKASPILFSAEINDCFSGRSSVDFIDDEIRRAGYFKEISDKIDEVKDIGYIQSWRDFEPIPKSPFYYYYHVQPVKPAGGGGGGFIPSKPSITIDGIMYEKQNPMVIINGKFYYKGDVVNRSKIVQINKNSITVNHFGKMITIKMEN